MKRILSIFLIAICVASVLAVVKARAAETGITDDEVYRYTVVDNEYVELTRCVNPRNAELNADGSYTIPSEIGGYKVRTLGTNLFRNSGTPAEKVIVPNTVTEIKRHAFFCSLGHLPEEERVFPTEIELPDSLVTIGDYAFESCRFTSVKIPASVKNIGKGAFSGSWLNSVVVPKTVETLGDYAFYECGSLTKAVIKAPLKQIGENTFAYDSRLRSVSLPDTVEIIGEEAFSECNFTEFSFPKNLREIGWMAFYEVPLKTAVINENVKTDWTSLGNGEGWPDYGFEMCARYVEGEDKSYHKTLTEKLTYYDNGEFRTPCTYIIPNKNLTYDFKYTGNIRLRIDGKKATGWKSSNPKAISIDKDGTLTMLTKGKATITAKLSGGKTFKSTFRNFKAVELTRYYWFEENYDNFIEKLPDTLVLRKGESVRIGFWSKVRTIDNIYKSTSFAKITGRKTDCAATVTALKRGRTTVKFIINRQTLRLKLRIV